MVKRDAIRIELEQVRKSNRGVLTAQNVVSYAKDKSSALHSQFDWDNKSAGNKYRLWQARQLIALHVDVVEEDTSPVRAYVSLSSDRGKGGYRSTKDVMKRPAWREQLLSDAIREMERFRERYQSLKELAGVFEAMEAVRSKKRTPKRRKKSA